MLAEIPAVDTGLEASTEAVLMLRPEDRRGWEVVDHRSVYVGAYVCIETPATAEERAHYGCDVVGCCGIVERVEPLPDPDGGPGWVEVVLDWGVGWPVMPESTVTVCRDASHDHLSGCPAVDSDAGRPSEA